MDSADHLVRHALHFQVLVEPLLLVDGLLELFPVFLLHNSHLHLQLDGPGSLNI